VQANDRFIVGDGRNAHEQFGAGLLPASLAYAIKRPGSN
jgi:hypothetical protein